MILDFCQVDDISHHLPLTTRTLGTVSNWQPPQSLSPGFLVGYNTYELFLLGYLSILLQLYTPSRRMFSTQPQSLEWPALCKNELY